ncbi:MAG: hypothetical protein KDG52_20230 [Rhodocyclaceae bacterium]|nr:hypothetical protein [Rhodocyclaceae bacterium]
MLRSVAIACETIPERPQPTVVAEGRGRTVHSCYQGGVVPTPYPYYALVGLIFLPAIGAAATAKQCPAELAAEEPALPLSIEQEAIDRGVLDFDDLRVHGERLFTTAFNRCDGAGRPHTTVAGDKRPLPTRSDEGEAIASGQIARLRTSGPDSDACVICHNLPETGGAGSFTTNAFVLAETLDPVTLSTSPSRSNSRNPPGLHGTGPIEILAREMSEDLRWQAADLGDGEHVLETKGVRFSVEIAHGAVIRSEGVDRDLIIKPFTHAGSVVSLREFATSAMNQHFGMQAEERFDLNPDKGFDPDHDGDGIARELTIGDQTAISVWQAQLSTPTRVLPRDRTGRQRVRRGRRLFHDLGCATCHMPALVLETRLFVEPNPFNPPGTCAGAVDGCSEFTFDMTERGQPPRLEKLPGGRALVRAYTDLKRHNLCDEPGPDAIRYFCNEQLAQGRPDQDGRPGAEFFLTRRLWDVGTSGPYGHRGDIGTISEAILFHGGEARASRDAFASAPPGEQRAVVDFLKSLRVVPQRTQR